jgi:hypothetical protein
VLELPAAPEEPYLTESAGHLGLRLWLEALGDAGAALEISSSWKNDRYALMPDGESSTAVIWDVELESGTAADLFQAAALACISARAGLETQAVAGTGVTTSDGRHLRVSRPAPLRVRFLNTATAELMRKFD